MTTIKKHRALSLVCSTVAVILCAYFNNQAVALQDGPGGTYHTPTEMVMVARAERELEEAQKQESLARQQAIEERLKWIQEMGGDFKAEQAAIINELTRRQRVGEGYELTIKDGWKEKLSLPDDWNQYYRMIIKNGRAELVVMYLELLDARELIGSSWEDLQKRSWWVQRNLNIEDVSTGLKSVYGWKPYRNLSIRANALEILLLMNNLADSNPSLTV